MFYRYDSDFIHDLVEKEQMKSDKNLLTVLEFIEVRTHFWQNEDPLKGRRSTKDLGLKNPMIGVSRQDMWEELPFENYVQSILSRENPKSSRRGGRKTKR